MLFKTQRDFSRHQTRKRKNLYFTFVEVVVNLIQAIFFIEQVLLFDILQKFERKFEILSEKQFKGPTN